MTLLLLQSGPGKAGVSVSSEVAQFLARTSGLDATHINAYTALIDGLVADGIWARLDVLHVYATQNSTTALLNLVSGSYGGTLNASPAFAVDRGYTGIDGSATVYISTGFNPTTASTPKFTQNSAHISAWSVIDLSSNNPIMGLVNSAITSETNIYPRITATGYFRINSTAIAGVATATGNGHYIANRSTSSAVQGYKNGSSLLTNSSATSQALVNNPVLVLTTQNASGGTISGGPFQCAMASIGSALTSTDASNFYIRLRTYMTAVGAITVSAETSQFLARTSGLDATHINAYTALIDGLVADGIWSKLDMLHIYATQNSTTAQLNLVSSSYSAILNGAPIFTTDRGYTGIDTSSTVYINTQFNPVTATSPKFTQNSAHISEWALNSVASGSGTKAIGHSTTGYASEILPGYSGSTYFQITGATYAAYGTGSTIGHYVANRSASSATQAYRNGSGSGLGVGVDVSSALYSANIYTLASNVNGAAAGGAYQLCMASIGSSLSSTDATNFYNRLRTYMTVVGVP